MARVLYPDILRIVAAFMVIATHVITEIQGAIKPSSKEYVEYFIYKAITRSCVPIFIIISGMFLLDPNKKNVTIKSLYLKNILKMVISILFWSFLIYYVIYDIYIKRLINPELYGKVTKKVLKEKYESFRNTEYSPQHIWYIWMAIGLYAITPIIRKVVEDKTSLIYLLSLTTVLGSILPSLRQFLKDFGYTRTEHFFYVYNDLFMIGFSKYAGLYASGYFLKITKIPSRIRYIIYVLGVLMISCSVWLNVRYNRLAEKNETPRSNDIWFHFNDLPIVIYSISTFIFFQYEVARIKWNKICTKIIQIISGTTFGIYLMHYLLIYIIWEWELSKKIELPLEIQHPTLAVTLISLLIFVVGFIITYVMMKIPILNKISGLVNFDFMNGKPKPKPKSKSETDLRINTINNEDKQNNSKMANILPMYSNDFSKNLVQMNSQDKNEDRDHINDRTNDSITVFNPDNSNIYYSSSSTNSPNNSKENSIIDISKCSNSSENNNINDNSMIINSPSLMYITSSSVRRKDNNNNNVDNGSSENLYRLNNISDISISTTNLMNQNGYEKSIDALLESPK